MVLCGIHDVFYKSQMVDYNLSETIVIVTPFLSCRQPRKGDESDIGDPPKAQRTI